MVLLLSSSAAPKGCVKETAVYSRREPFFSSLQVGNGSRGVVTVSLLLFVDERFPFTILISDTYFVL